MATFKATNVRVVFEGKEFDAKDAGMSVPSAKLAKAETRVIEMVLEGIRLSCWQSAWRHGLTHVCLN